MRLLSCPVICFFSYFCGGYLGVLTWPTRGGLGFPNGGVVVRVVLGCCPRGGGVVDRMVGLLTDWGWVVDRLGGGLLTEGLGC